MKPSVSLAEAKNLLWRREARKEDTGKSYPAGGSPNSVLVADWAGFHGVVHVLYTDFPTLGKTPRPSAQSLAKAAVASVAKAPVGKDGISYLMQLIESGVETALTADYRSEVLQLTGKSSLAEALNHLREQRRKKP